MRADSIMMLLALIMLIRLYFYPTIVSFNKNLDGSWSTFVLNIFGGFFLVGWVGALLRATIPDSKKQYNFSKENDFSPNKDVGTEGNLNSLAFFEKKNEEELMLVKRQLDNAAQEKNLIGALFFP